MSDSTTSIHTRKMMMMMMMTLFLLSMAMTVTGSATGSSWNIDATSAATTTATTKTSITTSDFRTLEWLRPYLTTLMMVPEHSKQELRQHQDRRSFLRSLAAATAGHDHASHSKSRLSVFSSKADWTCTRNGYESMEDCTNSSTTDTTCVWCPMGSTEGMCVSSSQGSALEALQFPHLYCGKDGMPGDVFWTEFMACTRKGINESSCLNNPACQWCTVEDPTFGVCASQKFFALVKNMEGEDDDDDEGDKAAAAAATTTPAKTQQKHKAIRLEDVMSCSALERNTTVNALMDPTCHQHSNETKEDCEADACVYKILAEFAGSYALCLTPTQNTVVEFIEKAMKELEEEIDEMIEKEKEKVSELVDVIGVEGVDAEIPETAVVVEGEIQVGVVAGGNETEKEVEGEEKEGEVVNEGQSEIEKSGDKKTEDEEGVDVNEKVEVPDVENVDDNFDDDGADSTAGDETDGKDDDGEGRRNNF